MNPETPAGEHVGVEIRAGRPWFAVCCASCLLVLIFVGAIIGYLITQSGSQIKTGLPMMERFLNKLK